MCCIIFDSVCVCGASMCRCTAYAVCVCMFMHICVKVYMKAWDWQQEPSTIILYTIFPETELLTELRVTGVCKHTWLLCKFLGFELKFSRLSRWEIYWQMHFPGPEYASNCVNWIRQWKKARLLSLKILPEVCHLRKRAQTCPSWTPFSLSASSGTLL